MFLPAVAAAQPAGLAPVRPYIQGGDTTGIHLRGGAPFHLAHIRPGGQAAFLADDRIEAVRWLSDGYLIVRLSPALPAAALPAGLDLLLPANDRWKLSPTLAAGGSPGLPERLTLVVSDVGAFRAEWGRRLVITGVYAPAKVVGVELPAGFDGARLLASPLVTHIDRAGRRPREELAVAGLDLSVNRVGQARAGNPELDGGGLTVSVKENRYDTTDIDLWGRHRPAPQAARLTATHASTMATMIGGGGNTYYTGLGVAPAVTFTPADFLNLLPEPPAYYRDLGVSVQNHSYGVDIENFYGADASAYDASVADLPTLVHVFSAGNRGEEASAAGPYAGVAGYATLSGSFKMAKNVLTVGAVDDTGAVEARSSRGPAHDGRLKPDLVAFGRDGSSGGAAIVSGIALLLQQHYRRREGRLPSAALVRALLTGSADDAGAPGPDYASGFGNANARRAVATLDQGRYREDSLSQGGERRFPLRLPAGAVDLRLALAWTDPPAGANAARALVHDLDLELRRLDGAGRWLPWVLPAAPRPDSLAAPARRGRDSLNNLELISLAAPPAGDYEIVVRGRNIARGPQSFALAYCWEESGRFRWSFPAAADRLPAGLEAVVRWESTLSATATGRLELSLDGDTTWQVLTDTLALAAGYYRWTTPDTTAVARLRLHAGGAAYLSDIFAISPPPALRVGFNCPDSLLLFWNATPGARGYRLFRMGERYLDAGPVLTDTAVVLDKRTDPASHYAVAPLLPGGIAGLRSPAIDFTRQGVDCYVRSFLADLVDDEQGRLRLSLGSSYGLTQISIEKRRAGAFQPLFTAAATSRLEYTWTDAAPHPGANVYRARLRLANGGEVLSEEALLFYAGPQDHRLFPNPLKSGAPLQVISRGLPATAVFQLFDSAGRIIAQAPLLGGGVEEVDLGHLPAGVYGFWFLYEGERRQAGKLVVTP